MSEPSSCLILVIAGFLPNEIWRWLGVLFGRGLDEKSEIVLWVRAVAIAVLAGVIARLTLMPPPVLADVPAPVRTGAIAAGLVTFLLLRRSVLAGVLVAEATLVIGAALMGP